MEFVVALLLVVAIWSGMMSLLVSAKSRRPTTQYLAYLAKVQSSRTSATQPNANAPPFTGTIYTYQPMSRIWLTYISIGCILAAAMLIVVEVKRQN